MIEVGNEAARDRLVGVLAGLQDQLSDIAAMQRERADLRLSAQAADGTVEVTVNDRGQLLNAVIDKSYLDDHDFEELGDHITKAAEAAAQEAGRRTAELLAPINERHGQFPSFADIVEGAPHRSEMVPPGLDAFFATAQRQDPSETGAGEVFDQGGEADFPIVKR